jgi:hypothetical protein
MEKPEPVLLSTDLFDDDGGRLYYKASEMDAYIAELRASLREMTEYAEDHALTYADLWGVRRKDVQEAMKDEIDRARALIGEE